MKEKLNKLKPYIINMLIILSILLISFWINDIYPFGHQTIARNDAIYQYKPMLYHYIMRIKEGMLTSYTFTNGLGNPFIFNFLYYLSSPLNLLLIPFKTPDGMFNAIVILKAMIASLTTTYYASKKTNNNFVSTIIAVSYSLSSYFLAYYFNIMWLDAFMIFPLFQYGLEELMNKSKYNIYIASLAYIMISNFYIAFMICLYTFGYYIFNIIIKKDKYINKIKNFQLIGICTGVTCLICAHYIYATYDTFLTMGININPVTDDETILRIADMIKVLFCGQRIVVPFTQFSTYPNIALSTLFFSSFIYFFVNKKITIKEKIKNIIITLFIIFLIYSKTLNYIMNCFHVPIGYQFRYSFIISFYLVHLFIRNYQTFENKIDKKIYIINLILSAILIIEYLFKQIETYYFIFNIATLFIYNTLFAFYNNKKLFKYIFTGAIIVEMLTVTLLNFKDSFEIDTDNLNFHNNTTTYRELPNYNTEYDFNFNLYENKNTLTLFTSMTYNNIFADLNSLSCKTDDKAQVPRCNNTIVFNMLFNINANTPYYLEKIYAANNKINTLNLNSSDILENQKILLETLTNTKNIIKEEKLKVNKKKETKFKVNKTGFYTLNLFEEYKYIIIKDDLYVLHKENHKDKFVKESKLKKHYLKMSSTLTFYLDKDDVIEIIYKDKKNEDKEITVYYTTEDKLKKAYEKLSSNQIEYTTYEESKLEGTINIEKDQVIFTTIPYDKYWEVKIDGKKVIPHKVLNSLMAIDCPEGKHILSLEYKRSYPIPALISIMTLTGFIANIIIKKKGKKTC